MAKLVAELLLEAAAALERGQGAGLQQTASPSEPKVAVSESQPQPRPGTSTLQESRAASMARETVQSEVTRLFSPYARPNVKPLGNLRRSIPPKPTKKMTYTHKFFCLNGRRDDEVPKLSHRAELVQTGLGERKIVFSDKHCTAGEFEAHLQKEFPKLKDGGGFQLLRPYGSTRSKILEIIPCPAEGYTPKYLEAYGIHTATVYVRPLQRDLSLDKDLPPIENNSWTPRRRKTTSHLSPSTMARQPTLPTVRSIHTVLLLLQT
ncbi:hypothetical protein MHYP_G00042350 [Metynnis hypsauchen]